MTVPNFMSKTFFYQDLCREVGGGGVPPYRGMIRQKYPGADNVNKNKNTKYIISQIEYDVKILECKKGRYDIASVNMTLLFF